MKTIKTCAMMIVSIFVISTVLSSAELAAKPKIPKAMSIDTLTKHFQKSAAAGKKAICKKASVLKGQKPTPCRSFYGAACVPNPTLGNKWQNIGAEACSAICEGFTGFDDSKCMIWSPYSTPKLGSEALKDRLNKKVPVPPKVNKFISVMCAVQDELASPALNQICAAHAQLSN